MPAYKENLEGRRFNRLAYIKDAEVYIQPGGGKVRKSLFLCDCGKEVVLRTSDVKIGHTKSCGCLKIEGLVGRVKTHGMRGTRQYQVRYSMKDRCGNKNNRAYERYGGRGITYDSNRKTFQGFREDMQYGYNDNLTLDRIDNNGNYCKENCKRSTAKEQGRNKRNNIMYKGKCLSQWCEELGLNYKKAHQRLKRYGRSITRVLGLE